MVLPSQHPLYTHEQSYPQYNSSWTKPTQFSVSICVINNSFPWIFMSPIPALTYIGILTKFYSWLPLCTGYPNYLLSLDIRKKGLRVSLFIYLYRPVDRPNSHLEKIRDWSILNRVKFNSSKLVVLTISNKIARPMPIAIYYGKIPVHEVPSYKYLGLWVDNKLNWLLHIGKILEKLSIITKSLQGLSKGSWGVRLDVYRTLFHSIFIPVMIYGWKASAKTICDKFDREIRKFRLMVTRCQRSTSNVFILSLLKTQNFMGILQTEVLRTLVNQFHIVQSKRQAVYETYQKNRKVRVVPQCMDQYFFMLRGALESKIRDVEFDDVNNQYKVHPSKWALTKTTIHNAVTAISEGADKRGWVLYTDASAYSYGVGWGFAAFRHGFCLSMVYGSLTKCSVFIAEAYAILQAARFVNTLTGLGRKEIVEIRSDAQGLVRTFGKVVHVNILLCKIKDEFRIASQAGKNVVLRWIPGHKDITGNLYADRITKKAVDSKSTTAVMITKGDVGRILKEREKSARKAMWENFESRNVKLFLPDESALNSFLKSIPSMGLCQLVSGHTRLNDFVFRILRLIRSPLCECEESNETIMHYLLECPLYDELRKEIWTDFQPDVAYITKDWNKMNNFIVRRGRFDRSVRENMMRKMRKSGENRGA